MKLHKQITALVLTLVMVLSAAGCSSKDLTWAAKSGDDTVSTGVYLLELMMGYNDATSKLTDQTADVLKSTIEEKPAPQYITDYAKAEVAKLLAIRGEFAKRGLTLSEDDVKQATDYTEYLYSAGQEYYESNGVAKESVQYLNETTMMSLAIFKNIYGEGGEKAVTTDELKTAFGEKYTRSQYLLFPKVDTTTGAALTEEQLAKAKTQAEEYLKKAQEGASFTDLIYENEKSRQTDGTTVEKMAEADYDVYLENSAGYFPPTYEEAVLKAADNSITRLEDDYYIYIVRKLPVLEGDATMISGYLDTMLQDLKYEEYMTTTKEWGAAATVKYNTQVLSQYTPAKLKMTAEQLSSSSSSSESGSSDSSSSGSSAADSSSSESSQAPSSESSSEAATGSSSSAS